MSENVKLAHLWNSRKIKFENLICDANFDTFDQVARN